MPRKIVWCPYGKHPFQVEIKEGYVIAKALPQGENLDGLPGHDQACPICNRPLFIKYIQ
jgi:hypothetical protein